MTANVKESKETAVLSKLLNIMEIKIAQLTGSNGLQKQISELASEKQQLQQKLLQYEKDATRVPRLEERIKQLEVQGQEILFKEKQNLELKIQETSRRISALQDQIEKLKVEKQEKINLAFQYKLKEINLKKIIAKERDAILELKGKNQELKRTLRRLQRRLLRGGRLRHTQIQMDNEIIEEGIGDKTDEAVKEQIIALKEEINVREMKIQELEMKNRQLINQLAKSPARDLKLQVQNLRKEVDLREGKILQFESERKKLEQQISMLQARITDLQVNFQEQSKIINDRTRKIKDLETTLRTGIQDKSARGIIVDLQEENKGLREKVRALEKDVRILDRNAFSFKQQVDQYRAQVQALFKKNRDLLIQLQSGGGVPAATASRGVDMLDEVSEIEMEMKDKDRKIRRMEQRVKDLEQEVEKMRFNMSSRDIKIDELNNIIDEFKQVMAKANIKIGIG
ncbi:MAG: hypothetical protein ACTSRB_18040, partial [Candidatus Helarchaeota archaeon]